MKGVGSTIESPKSRSLKKGQNAPFSFMSRYRIKRAILHT